jgi:hypothetical protein
VGADAAALALRSLSHVLKACYDQKLTSNQIAHIKLGELMAFAETAASFCRAAAKPELSESVIFSQDAWRAMSRINAAYAASWVSSEGLNLVAGTTASDTAGLVDALDLKAVAKAHKGVVADMDVVAINMVETFKEEPIA